MIGKRFGRLTVKAFVEKVSIVQENGRKQNIYYFECVCDCGVVKVLRQAGLYSTKSCGCQQVDENKSRALDISGQKFNKLTALIKDDTTGKWICSCDCGQETSVPVANLINGNTKSCGCLQRAYAKDSMNEKHRSTRLAQGLSPDKPLSSKSSIERLEFRSLSSYTMERDSYTCAWCSKIGGQLHVHHIETWATSVEKRFDKTNLVTLCIGCHRKVHQDNNFGPVDPYMSILLQGFANEQESILAARIELTPN